MGDNSLIKPTMNKLLLISTLTGTIVDIISAHTIAASWVSLLPWGIIGLGLGFFLKIKNKVCGVEQYTAFLCLLLFW